MWRWVDLGWRWVGLGVGWVGLGVEMGRFRCGDG